MCRDQERSALKADRTSQHAVLNSRYFGQPEAYLRGSVNGNLCQVSPAQPQHPVGPGDAQPLLVGRFCRLSR
jgi:hypothetical protein